MSSCQCPDPPKGGHECEPHQMAICRVENGACRGSCHSPPSGSNEQTGRSWAYGVISGRPRSPSQPLTPQEESVLDSGRYYDSLTGMEVRFSLPRRWGEERTLEAKA